MTRRHGIGRVSLRPAPALLRDLTVVMAVLVVCLHGESSCAANAQASLQVEGLYTAPGETSEVRLGRPMFDSATTMPARAGAVEVSVNVDKGAPYILVIEGAGEGLRILGTGQPRVVAIDGDGALENWSSTGLIDVQVLY